MNRNPAPAWLPLTPQLEPPSPHPTTQPAPAPPPPPPPASTPRAPAPVGPCPPSHLRAPASAAATQRGVFHGRASGRPPRWAAEPAHLRCAPETGKVRRGTRDCWEGENGLEWSWTGWSELGPGELDLDAEKSSKPAGAHAVTEKLPHLLGGRPVVPSSRGTCVGQDPPGYDDWPRGGSTAREHGGTWQGLLGHTVLRVGWRCALWIPLWVEPRRDGEETAAVAVEHGRCQRFPELWICQQFQGFFVGPVRFHRGCGLQQ
mmetsp:Transcript_31860/g.71402  ORF Transcript_31860/g.71402 Transcript_31860/m.71402 type:complete len:260 (+) Transcript_31860:3472-4251(+)